MGSYFSSLCLSPWTKHWQHNKRWIHSSNIKERSSPSWSPSFKHCPLQMSPFQFRKTRQPTYLINKSLDPSTQREMNAVHLSQAASKKQEKKRWLRWWKWLKSAAREARGRRVPQPWCSEKERCCDWLTLPSLPLHTISLACTLILSLFPHTLTHTHTHKPSLFLVLSPSASRSLPRLLPSQLHLRLPATLFCLSHWLSPRGKFG